MEQKKVLNRNEMHEVKIVYERPLISTMPKINSSFDTEKVLRSFLDTKRIDHKEFFWLILMNRSNSVLGISEIGSGTDTGVAVHIKEIFQLVLLSNACGIIIAHNHPSGSLKPSAADKQITQKIYDVGKLLDVMILDHLILTSESYYSFADNGIL